MGTNNSKLARRLVGERIQAARGKLSRDAFCKKLSENPLAPSSHPLFPDTFKQWELGRNQINIDWIPAICDVLDCEVGYLFGEFPDKHRCETTLREITGLSDAAVQVLCDKDETPIGRIARLREMGHSPSQTEIDAAKEFEYYTLVAVEQDYYNERYKKDNLLPEDPLSDREKRELEKLIDDERSFIHSPESFDSDYRYSRSALEALFKASSFETFLNKIGRCLPNRIEESLFNPFDSDDDDLVLEDIRDQRRLTVQFYAGKIAEEIMEEYEHG